MNDHNNDILLLHQDGDDDDDAFPKVRFNGCLGWLNLTSDEIVFQDASVGVELKWEMSSLVEEMIHPMTSTIDLTFDMYGIREKVSFQMTSFPEIARFRQCVAQRKGAQKSKVDFSKPPSMKKLPNDLSDDASGSLHSIKSFYDEESLFSARSAKYHKEPDEESLTLASVMEEPADDIADNPNPIPGTSYQPEAPATRNPTSATKSRQTSILAPNLLRKTSLNLQPTEPRTNMVTPVLQSTLSGLTDLDLASASTSHTVDISGELGDEAQEFGSKKHPWQDSDATLLVANLNLSKSSALNAPLYASRTSILDESNQEGTGTPARDNTTFPTPPPSISNNTNFTNHTSNTTSNTTNSATIKPGAVSVSGSAPLSSRKQTYSPPPSVTTTSNTNTHANTSPGATAVHIPVPKRKQDHRARSHLPHRQSQSPPHKRDRQTSTTATTSSLAGAHSIASAPPSGKPSRRSQIIDSSSLSTHGAIAKASEPNTANPTFTVPRSVQHLPNSENIEPGSLALDPRQVTNEETPTAGDERQAHLSQQLVEQAQTRKQLVGDELRTLQLERAAAQDAELALSKQISHDGSTLVSFTNNRLQMNGAKPSSHLPSLDQPEAVELTTIEHSHHQADISTTRPADNQSEESTKSMEAQTDTTGNNSVDHNNSSSDPALGHLIEATLVEEGSSLLLNRLSAVLALPVDVVNEDQRRRKWNLYMGAGCCLAVIIMVVALSVALTVGGGSANPDAPVVWSEEERLAILKEKMQPFWGPDENVDDDESSPHNQALTWMAVEDRLSQNLLQEGNDDKLKQRFLLAVFYYSVTGEEKSLLYCKPPETGESASCIHHVLETYSTEGVYYDQKMKEPAFRWLSYVDECGWGGITCTDGIHVDRLELAGYEIEAELPVQLAYLSTLTVLDLQVNNFRGSLPAEWGRISGESPDSSALETIRLDRNELTGSIPIEWCKLNLKDLVLSNNKLTGELPDCSFGTVENFSVLFNQLTGSIPSVFGTLSSLQRLHLAGNHFGGDFPLCHASKMHVLEASADCADPLSDYYLECSCCTTCCSGDEDIDACRLKLAEFHNST